MPTFTFDETTVSISDGLFDRMVARYKASIGWTGQEIRFPFNATQSHAELIVCNVMIEAKQMPYASLDKRLAIANGIMKGVG